MTRRLDKETRRMSRMRKERVDRNREEHESRRLGEVERVYGWENSAFAEVTRASMLKSRW